MALIGAARTFVKVVAEQAPGSGGAARQDAEVDDTISSGDAYGSDKGVSHASVRTPRLVLTGDVLSAMWTAALSLHKRHPEVISQVAWYTPHDGYREGSPPGLVAVPELEKDLGGVTSIPPSVRAWPYLNVAEKFPRGVLVMRLVVFGKSVHLIEIQRRSPVAASDEKKAIKAEAFCGLAVQLEDDGDLREWLSDFLVGLRYRKGVVHRALKAAGAPGRANWYQHRFSEDEIAPGERSLVNGLRRIGHSVLDR